jgi:hypothetical protein
MVRTLWHYDIMDIGVSDIFILDILISEILP